MGIPDAPGEPDVPFPRCHDDDCFMAGVDHAHPSGKSETAEELRVRMQTIGFAQEIVMQAEPPGSISFNTALRLVAQTPTHPREVRAMAERLADGMVRIPALEKLGIEFRRAAKRDRLKQPGQTPWPIPLPPAHFLNWRYWIIYGVGGGIVRGAKAAWREFNLSIGRK